MLSFSSSGVSSTGSLHLSTASEVEDVLELEPDVNAKVHISSTYISTSDAPQRPLLPAKPSVGQSVKCAVPNVPRPVPPRPPPPPPRSMPVPASLPLAANKDLRLDVSEVCEGISSVQITVSGADCASSSSAASSPTMNGKPSRADLIRMKDLILGDASMEAS